MPFIVTLFDYFSLHSHFSSHFHSLINFFHLSFLKLEFVLIIYFDFSTSDIIPFSLISLLFKPMASLPFILNCFSHHFFLWRRAFLHSLIFVILQSLTSPQTILINSSYIYHTWPQFHLVSLISFIFYTFDIIAFYSHQSSLHFKPLVPYHFTIINLPYHFNQWSHISLLSLINLTFSICDHGSLYNH